MDQSEENHPQNNKPSYDQQVELYYRETDVQSQRSSSFEKSDKVQAFSYLSKFGVSPYTKRCQRQFKNNFHARLMHTISPELVFMPSLDRMLTSHMHSKQDLSEKV